MLLEDDRVRRGVGLALAGYAVFLAVILLNPSAGVPSASVSWLTELAVRAHLPAQLTASGRIEFVANVLILVPVPVLGSLIWPRTTWRDWTAYGFVISAGVELVQGLLLPSRSATFVDVVANTLGAGTGALLVLLLRRVLLAPGGTPGQ